MLKNVGHARRTKKQQTPGRNASKDMCDPRFRRLSAALLCRFSAECTKAAAVNHPRRFHPPIPAAITTLATIPASVLTSAPASVNRVFVTFAAIKYTDIV